MKIGFLFVFTLTLLLNLRGQTSSTQEINILSQNIVVNTKLSQDDLIHTIEMFFEDSLHLSTTTTKMHIVTKWDTHCLRETKKFLWLIPIEQAVDTVTMRYIIDAESSKKISFKSNIVEDKKQDHKNMLKMAKLDAIDVKRRLRKYIKASSI